MIQAWTQTFVDNPRNWNCIVCGWEGKSSEQLTADNPFMPVEFMHPDKHLVYGCPECKSTNQFYWKCDKKGCENAEIGGKQLENGELLLWCRKHEPR